MRALALSLLASVLLVLTALPMPSQAEEGWRVHPLGGDDLEVRLPRAWTALVDDLWGRLIATSDDAPVVRLVATRLPAEPDATLADIRDGILDGLFGEPGESAETEDEARRDIGGEPTLWTLVAYETQAGPRRSLLVLQRDVALRFDVAADAFAKRRALIVEIASGLAASPAKEKVDADVALEAKVKAEADVEIEVEESAALKRLTELDLLREFMTRVPRTRADLADLARAMGQEDGVDEALDILDQLVEASGPAGQEMLKLVGWRRFSQPVPESLRFRDQDFVRTVEAANAQRWFGPDEQGAYDLARSAWAETKRYTERVENEAGARAADQMLANLRHDPALEAMTLFSKSAPPFLVVYVAPEADAPPSPEERAAIEARLKSEARVLKAVYERFIEEYAEPFSLRPLEAPYGGLPELKVGMRSYADGVVLVTLIPADGDVATTLVGGKTEQRSQPTLPRFAPNRPEQLILDPRPDRRATAMIGAAQLFDAFTRQRSRWARPKPGFVAPVDGFVRRFSAMREQDDGTFTFSRSDSPNLERMRRAATRLAERSNTRYPIIPLKDLVSFGTLREAWEGMKRLGKTLPQGPEALEQSSALRDQSWALATFLLEAEDGRWRAKAMRVLEAALNREMGRGGLNAAVFTRAFELRSDADWKLLETAWERFILEDLLESAPKPQSIEAPIEIRFVTKTVPSGERITQISVVGSDQPPVAFPGVDPKRALDLIASQVKALLDASPQRMVELQIEDDAPSSIAYGDVVLLINRLTALGVKNISLRRAMPIPRPGSGGR